jgi:hypothetical protein
VNPAHSTQYVSFKVTQIACLKEASIVSLVRPDIGIIGCMDRPMLGHSSLKNFEILYFVLEGVQNSKPLNLRIST